MADFQFEKLPLLDAQLISYFSMGDQRGSFAKIFEREIYVKAGIDFHIAESFVSVSAHNVVRGMHFQLKNPQAKIVSVLQGKIWDCIVDIRRNSVTYKQWIGVELSSENHQALYVPKGFAHGFLSLADNTVMLYQCDGAYDKDTDTGIMIDDHDLNIQWPIELNSAIRSERDLVLMSFREFEKKFNSI